MGNIGHVPNDSFPIGNGLLIKSDGLRVDTVLARIVIPTYCSIYTINKAGGFIGLDLTNGTNASFTNIFINPDDLHPIAKNPLN